MASPVNKTDSVRAVAAAAAFVVAGFLLVRLNDVLLMAFGAVLVAILLHAVAAPIRRISRLGAMQSLVVAVLVMVACGAGVLWLFGSQAAAQLAGLSDLLPSAWLKVRTWLAAQPLGPMVLDELGRSRPQAWLLGIGPKALTSISASAVGAVIVAFAGLYLAFNPKSYFDGVLALVPRVARARTEAVLTACHQALQQWLIGQLFSMVLVGSTVAAGLWLAGCPSPMALGVIAGLGQFIPVIGPMAAAIPGVLAAVAVSPQVLVWTSVVYLAASQFEANVVAPLLLRQMVEVPMAVSLFAVLAAGVLLGPLGALFATPLAVVAYVAIRMTYVEGLNGGPAAPLESSS